VRAVLRAIAPAAIFAAVAGIVPLGSAGIAAAADGLVSQGKAVTASSAGGSAYAAKYAVDGNTSTRWASAAKVDPQWIQVDLGTKYTVSKVVLQWAASCAKTYKVQVSTDAKTYSTAYSTTSGNGGTDTLTVTKSARYVRVTGSVRCRSTGGYSLYEFQVFGHKSAQPFVLSSSAFANNGHIPDKYTCQGQGHGGLNISPPLSWGSGPSGTKSYAIVFTDTGNGIKHWAIWDIPTSVHSLAEGLPNGYDVPGLTPAKQKSWGKGTAATQFFGPCPGGVDHAYTFTLYAVNTTTLPGASSASLPADVEPIMQSHNVGSVVLTGHSTATR